MIDMLILIAETDVEGKIKRIWTLDNFNIHDHVMNVYNSYRLIIYFVVRHNKIENTSRPPSFFHISSSM